MNWPLRKKDILTLLNRLCPYFEIIAVLLCRCFVVLHFVFRCFVISLFCKFAVLLFVVLYPIRSKGRGSGGIRIEFWLSLFCFNKLHTARIWRGNFLPRCTYFAVSIFLHFHAWIADCFYADVRKHLQLGIFLKNYFLCK